MQQTKTHVSGSHHSLAGHSSGSDYTTEPQLGRSLQWKANVCSRPKCRQLSRAVIELLLDCFCLLNMLNHAFDSTDHMIDQELRRQMNAGDWCRRKFPTPICKQP